MINLNNNNNNSIKKNNKINNIIKDKIEIINKMYNMLLKDKNKLKILKICNIILNIFYIIIY